MATTTRTVTAFELIKALSTHPCTAWRISTGKRYERFVTALLYETGGTGLLEINRALQCENCRGVLIECAEEHA